MAEDRDSYAEEEPEAPIELPAERARGADIVLRTRGMRILFLVGLAGFVLFVLVFLVLGSRTS